MRPLSTTDGRSVEVINPGQHNHDAGPDFFNAKVKIDGQVWVGNVEIHQRSSDWFRHHHDNDAAYDNVILHVVGLADVPVPLPHNPDQFIPQLQLDVPLQVMQNYDTLLRSDALPRCRDVVSTLNKLTLHSWLSALQVERLEQRMEQVLQRLTACGNDWERTFFITVARNFGFGINGDAFEAWANTLQPSAIGKHRDDLFQIEAIFFGQAGLLDTAPDPTPDYFLRLQQEYRFMQRKFSLTPINPSRWRFLRLRPQNFPHIRIAQLAALYCQQRLNFSRMLEVRDVAQLSELFSASVSTFWQTHYNFSAEETTHHTGQLSKSSLDLLCINTVVPVLFAYGRYKSNEVLQEQALALLDQLKPERNAIVEAWEQAGVHAESAADTQALIHLTRNYCEPHDCLRCRFGYEFIRRNPDFLREEEEG